MHDNSTPRADILSTPITAEVAAILLAQSRYADRRLHAACRSLDPDQLDKPFSMGPGSVRATLAHNLGALRVWADAYACRPRRAWLPDEGPFTVAQMETIAEELHDDWADIAPRFPLGEVLSRTRGDTIYRYTRAHIIAHVTTHSVHHRAQIVNMLRQLGVEDRPSGSVMAWVESEIFTPMPAPGAASA